MPDRGTYRTDREPPARQRRVSKRLIIRRRLMKVTTAVEITFDDDFDLTCEKLAEIADRLQNACEAEFPLALAVHVRVPSEAK